jgi:hypothetical protein
MDFYKDFTCTVSQMHRARLIRRSAIVTQAERHLVSRGRKNDKGVKLLVKELLGYQKEVVKTQ